MKNLKDIFSLLIITCFVLRLYTEAIKTVKFPDDLLLGAASAAYQVEGAWDEDGKGENIWDRMTHSRPEKISDRSNGDVACNGYHKTKGDVALLKDLGLQFYRFSLSWSRILPTGFSNKINQAGIDYYNSLINELLANNIMPMVTIYHFDLPQPLQDLGGFANPLIVRWFGDYAKIVFEYFGDRVKTWITINEPKQICEYGYGNGLLAPGIESPGIGNYVCTHHLLKAHAHAYHLYDKHFRPKQNGRIGLTVECAWSEPASQKNGDIDAADRRRQFDFGLYTNAVFHKDGDYPNIVKEFVAQRSKEEGFSHSRLPQFTNDEINFIKGSSDFFGLNHYTTFFVTDRQSDPIGDPSLDKDTRVESFQDDEWLTGSADYFKLVPWGFRNILKYIKTNYGDPEVYITENGFPDLGEIDDNNRIKYYNGNLQAMLEAVYQDKVQVKYYAAWSLTDNFEWLSGYTLKFGLYHVNFTDPAKTRTPKASARFYKELLSTRKIILENEEL